MTQDRYDCGLSYEFRNALVKWIKLFSMKVTGLKRIPLVLLLFLILVPLPLLILVSFKKLNLWLTAPNYTMCDITRNIRCG